MATISDLIPSTFIFSVALLLPYVSIVCLLIALATCCCFYSAKVLQRSTSRQVESSEGLHRSIDPVIKEDLPPSYLELPRSSPVNSNEDPPSYITC